jgi:hypothetical protein
MTLWAGYLLGKTLWEVRPLGTIAPVFRIEGPVINQSAAPDAQFEERKKRQRVREQLGKFLKEGEELKNTSLTGHSTTKDYRDEFNLWVGRVSGYLTKNLDSSYADRFNNPPNHSLPNTAIVYGTTRYGVRPPDFAILWRDIDDRTSTLTDFIKELH